MRNPAYKLRNEKIETPFSREMLYALNILNGSFDIISEFKKRVGETLKGVNFNLGSNKEIRGINFRSELLLYGLYCRDIKNDQAAVHGKDAFIWNGNGITQIDKDLVQRYGTGEYVVDKVLWKEVGEIEKKYRAEVVELVG